MPITPSIFCAFDANPSLEVRGVFLDSLKAFDKFWHGCILCKLTEIYNNLPCLIKSFLHNRYQKVDLNGLS